MQKALTQFPKRWRLSVLSATCVLVSEVYAFHAFKEDRSKSLIVQSQYIIRFQSHYPFLLCCVTSLYVQLLIFPFFSQKELFVIYTRHFVHYMLLACEKMSIAQLEDNHYVSHHFSHGMQINYFYLSYYNTHTHHLL